MTHKQVALLTSARIGILAYLPYFLDQGIKSLPYVP